MSIPQATVGAPARRTAGVLEPFNWLWRLFSNVRFALAMILVFVLLSFAGTAISQVPPPMRHDPALVERWVGAMTDRYGVFTMPMNQAGLFDVFNSTVYRMLLGLLTVSVFICTANRAPAVWRNVMTVPFQRRESYYLKAEHHATAEGISLSPPQALEALTAAWRKLGYRVVAETGGSAIHVYADRYRHARLATFVNHLGLIMLLAGGATTGLLGERNDGFVIPVETTRAVGLGTNYTVHLENFTDEYYLSGGAKDYRSDVVVYEGGQEIKRATVRVNEPLLVGPVKIHQAYFGQAVVVQVRKGGEVIYQDSVPLAYTALQYGFRPVGFFKLPGEGIAVDLVAAEDAGDAAVRAGQVAIFGYPLGSEEPLFGGLLTQRQTQTWNDLEFTFVRETQFSGFQAVRDPGAPIFFIAAGLMLAGILIVFYFPHRKLWALIEPRPDGSRVVLAGLCQKNPSFPTEFSAAVESAERALTDKNDPVAVERN